MWLVFIGRSRHDWNTRILCHIMQYKESFTRGPAIPYSWMGVLLNKIIEIDHFCLFLLLKPKSFDFSFLKEYL